VIAPAGPVKAQIAPPVHAPVASPPAPTPTATGPRLSLSLADAVFIGLRDNRQVKSAYINRIAQKFDLFVVQARFRPTAVLAASGQLSGQSAQTGGSTITLAPTATWLIPTGGQFQFSWSRTDNRGGVGGGDNTTTSVSFTQPLLKGAGIAVNMAPIRTAELQEKINRLSLKSTVSATVTAIVEAYRSLLQAQDQLVIAEDSLARSRQQLTVNQALIDAGRMAAADIVQTQADIANQQVALLGAQQQRNSAQLSLLTLLAMDLHTNVVAGDTLKAEHVAIDLDHAIAIALDNRMDYLSERLALEQARINLMLAKNNRLWNLAVVGNAQHTAQTLTGPTQYVKDPLTGNLVAQSVLGGNSGAVGLQLSIPLGDFSLRQGEIDASVATHSQEINLEDLRQQVESQVRDSVQAVEMSWLQVDAARLARELAAHTLDLEKERLTAGRVSNFEVLTFETNLRAADTQELDAAIAYLNALTTLDQQLGTTLDTWKVSLND